MPRNKARYTPVPLESVLAPQDPRSPVFGPPVASLPYSPVPLDQPEVWRAELEREGFTVVSAVAGEEEVGVARALLWEWLEGLGTGIEERRPATWTDDAWPDWPGIKKYGSCKSEGAAHQPAAWYLRGLPRLKAVFAELWGTEELLVSMDGIILWRPWRGKPERRPGSSKLHVDQNPSGRPGFQCVQGMLPLYPVDGQVGGTVVVPRSHGQQAALLARNPRWAADTARDFCVLGEGDPLQGQERLVPLQPGDLLLWDSRLLHAGSVGPGADLAPNQLARASLCVCMGPRARAAPGALAARKEAVGEGWCYSHWPWEARGTRGQLSQRGRRRTTPPILTAEQQELV